MVRIDLVVVVYDLRNDDLYVLDGLIMIIGSTTLKKDEL